jgi:K+-sensing histidine kinase KdpD
MVLSSISHHLKSPLNGCLGLLETATKYCSDQIRTEFIEPSLNCNKLLLNTLNNFLDLTEIDTGKFEYEI